MYQSLHQNRGPLLSLVEHTTNLSTWEVEAREWSSTSKLEKNLPAFKDACCSCRGPRLCSQNPHSSSQSSETPDAGDLIPFYQLPWVPCMHMVHIHTYIQAKHSQINKNIFKKKSFGSFLATERTRSQPELYENISQKRQKNTSALPTILTSGAKHQALCCLQGWIVSSFLFFQNVPFIEIYYD